MINLNMLKSDLAEWATEKNNVYIGRENSQLKGSEWSNPFKIDTTISDGREKCIEKYREYVLKNQAFMGKLNELQGKNSDVGAYP